MDSSPLNKAIEVLVARGYTDEQIAQFCADLSKAAFTGAYTKVLETLSNEEVNRIEALPDEGVEAEVRKLYKEKTGEDLQAVMDSFFTRFSDGFLAEYEKQQSPVPALPQLPADVAQLKKDIELALAEKVLALVESGKITYDESQDLARYILSQIDKATTAQEFIAFLQDVASKNEEFKETWDFYSMKIGDKEQTGQKLDELKNKLLQEMGGSK